MPLRRYVAPKGMPACDGLRGAAPWVTRSAMSERGRFSDADREAVYRAIHQRRDVRNYKPDPVPDETLTRILGAAHRAPSVGFMQPWNFVLLRERALRQRVYDHFAEVNARAAEVWRDDKKRTYQALKLQGILDAPLNLLITCDRTRGGEHVLGRFTMRDTDVYSTCLAVQNLWLAARAEGIGVGWMSIMEPEVITGLLGLPSQVEPIAYLTMGYPVEFAEQPMLSQLGWEERRELSELVFEERWGAHACLDVSLQSPPHQRVERGHSVAPFPAIPSAARERNDALTKPRGSLGKIESLALQLAALQQTAQPTCEDVHLTLFAGDHGVTEERVSAYRRDTTLKLVYSYLAGGGVMNAFAREQRVAVHVVDVGVDHDFGEARGLHHHKVRRGTRNFTREPAMTADECTRAIVAGRHVVERLPRLSVLAVGEVGIGNSTSAAALAAALLGLAPAQVVGRGTGVDERGIERKRDVLTRALGLHVDALDPCDANELLRRLGGFEIAALVGAIEAGAARGALVLLDGMMTAVAGLIAVRRQPSIAPYLVASHRSAEPAHAALLEALSLEPLLELGLCLGEGSGALLAVSLLRSACALMREVRTYEEANIARPELGESDPLM
jgi:nicotinate-nucleotide--dimethylbenzimidazole phosphoribosyltransferase